MAPVTDAERPLPPGELVLRRYRIEAPIGRGGLAVVYRATDLTTGATVAVKVLRRALAEASSVSARFLREARIARRLVHPAVPRGLAVGVTAGGAPALVVEHVVGETLRARIEREGRLPVREALLVGSRVAEALAAAHRASIVHRDVKPDNVMLTDGAAAPDGVRVLDFGLAFVLDEPRLSATRAVLGTPEYIAPEQARGERVTAAADVYALGATLVHALTGATLFAGAAFLQFEAHARGALPDLRARRPELTPALVACLAAMLRKEPAGRPSDAARIARDLASLAEGRDPVDDDAPTERFERPGDDPASLREGLQREGDALLELTRQSSAAHARLVEQIVALATDRFERGVEDVSAREESLERALERIQHEARGRQEAALARIRALRRRLDGR
jgi:serine/threonine protein kinase